LRADRDGDLVAAAGGSLSFADCRRVTAARHLIDNQWHQQLSLAQIARSSGLNRSKLSRGFRELYGCSVMEALAERRLGEARRQLIATDLPIGLIGYRSGYQNNASFSRAFGRRFGVPPSDFRMRAAA
jgi:AraC family transcriptional activator of pyochelin receptor